MGEWVGHKQTVQCFDCAKSGKISIKMECLSDEGEETQGVSGNMQHCFPEVTIRMKNHKVFNGVACRMIERLEGR